MNYQAITTEAQEKQSKLFKEVGLFFAFSIKQFEEGKAENPIAKGEKYASLGNGGYLPSKNIKEFEKGMQEISDWQKAEVKKLDSEKVILYELNNYECFYTGDIYNAMPALEELGYTREEVVSVYNKYYELEDQVMRDRIAEVA